MKTAENESIVMYKTRALLQDLSAATTAFQIHGGRQLAVDRSNRLMGEYVAMRSRHFAVLLRQNAAGMVLYALASNGVARLGWLVGDSRTTVTWQLVAAELIVTVILGSFMKIGKQIETFFDLYCGVNKTRAFARLRNRSAGRVIDVGMGCSCALERPFCQHAWHAQRLHYPDLSIAAGETVAIVGTSGYGKSLLVKCWLA